MQSAVVGIAISDEFEIVFDTLETTRKAQNLTADPRIAFVFGGTADGDTRTVQLEGLAELPAGESLRAARDLYFKVFPDGPERLAWPGIVHFRVRPQWLRYSDYGVEPPLIVELDAAGLAGLR